MSITYVSVFIVQAGNSYELISIAVIMASRSKMKKIEDECRFFKEKWSMDYFFENYKNKVVCLICSETISIPILKEYNNTTTILHNNSLRVSSSNIKPDISALVQGMQCQVSHLQVLANVMQIKSLRRYNVW